jgi:hypothetical protein
METPFLEISGAGINLAHVESLSNLSGKAGTPVHVHFLSGNNITLAGEDADGLRRAFADGGTVKPPAPPAPKAAEAPAGQVSAADVAAAQPKKVIA